MLVDMSAAHRSGEVNVELEQILGQRRRGGIDLRLRLSPHPRLLEAFDTEPRVRRRTDRGSARD
jgi:hypothetical protein